VPPLPAGTRRGWASAGSGFPAGSGSGWPSRACSCATRSCCCWTRPRPRWTSRARRRCRQGSMRTPDVSGVYIDRIASAEATASHFHHVITLPHVNIVRQNTVQLMTAGWSIHITNLTPGSECNPSSRRRWTGSSRWGGTPRWWWRTGCRRQGGITCLQSFTRCLRLLSDVLFSLLPLKRPR
jgi:hypothetical protein